MRLIDADALEPSEVYMNYGFTRIVYMDDIDEMPTIDAVRVVRCKECRWFDKTEDSSYGYCHAMKHGYYSKHWEISIYRTYKEDFYCADGEKREVEE